MSKQREDGETRAPEPTDRAEPVAPPSGSLTKELVRVEEANFAFYEAFHKREIERMEQLWSRSPYARCVHPGWEPVVGWEDIRQSWIDIFRTMKSIVFTLEDVHVEVADRTAWVNLVAHADVTTEDGESFQTSVVATTIFEKVRDRWGIVLYHSSHFVEDEEMEEDDDDLDIDGEIGGGSNSGMPPN